MVDLGTLTWTRLTTNTEGKYLFSAAGLSNIIKKPASLSENGSVICAKYITISGDKPIQNIQGIAVHTNGNVLVYTAGTWRESLGGYRRVVEEGASCMTPRLPAPTCVLSWRTSNKQPPSR